MVTKAIEFSSDYCIKEALKNIERSHWNYNQLIDPNNSFIVNTVKTTDKLNPKSILIKEKEELTQYIAISTIAHCYDGWNLLSRTVESYINGDISTAFHLGYYSELRAVMSIMACKSIGIFNRTHFYFDKLNEINMFRGSTHDIADQLYNKWSKSENEINLLANYIKYNNVSLSEWIRSLMSTDTYIQVIIEDWLKAWSLDIQLSQKEHFIRKEMSYRPRFSRPEIKIKSGLKNLINIWKGLAPSESNRFHEIDLHLCRCAIESSILPRISTENRPFPIEIMKGKVYTNKILSMFDELGIKPSANEIEFFQRKINPEDHIIIQESKKENIFDDPIPMICRSILLLRIATGKTETLLNESRINIKSLDFWWKSVAYNMGIIDSKEYSPDPFDLFADVQETIDTIETDLDELSNLNQVLTQESREINIIKQFQRACFWGIGL